MKNLKTKILAMVFIFVVCVLAFFTISEYGHNPGVDSGTKIEVKNSIIGGITSQEALEAAEKYLKTLISVPVSTTGKSLKRIYNEHHIKKVTISTVKWPLISDRLDMMNSDISPCNLLVDDILTYCASEDRNKTWEFHCIRASAIQANDESLCEEITEELIKKECNKNEYSHEKNQDSHNLCVKQFFPEERDECYKDIAIIKKDDSICYLMDDSNYYSCFQCVELAKYPEVKDGTEVYEITFLYRGCNLIHTYFGLFGCGGDNFFRIFVNKEGEMVFVDIPLQRL